MKIHSTGKVQFILRYRSPDRNRREFRIGQFGVVGADKARRKAKALIGMIEEGRDPASERKLGLAAARICNDVIDTYLDWAARHLLDLTEASFGWSSTKWVSERTPWRCTSVRH